MQDLQCCLFNFCVKIKGGDRQKLIHTFILGFVIFFSHLVRNILKLTPFGSGKFCHFFMRELSSFEFLGGSNKP